MEQTVLMPSVASEFTEVFIRGRQDSGVALAVVFHTSTVTVELLGDTLRELLEAVLKAVLSCQETFPG